MVSSTRRSFGRRKPSPRPGLFLFATLVTAGALAFCIYLVSTSLPYLAASPTADPRFGALNACLMRALPENRLGFALSPDGNRGATYGEGKLVLCTDAQPRTLDIPGVRNAAFDFSGALWFATEPSDSAGAGLWHLVANAPKPVRVGELAPLTLAGHAQGVVALEASGRLVSLNSEDAVTGHAQLPGPVTGDVVLTSDVEGRRIGLVAGSGVFTFNAADLKPLRAEAPCQAEFLWWSTQPGQAIVSCAPQASWALTLQVETGERDTAPARPRIRSVLAQRANVYVQACEHLPCSAPNP
ncbi:MAG: hypothetical protein ACT4TC_03020 [Myxococcaceae bacterium]